MLRPVKIIIAGVDNFSKQFEESTRKVKAIGAGLKTVGTAMTAGITAPLVGADIAALKLSTDLNAAMANVQSLGLTSDRTAELKANVQDLAIVTGKSTVLISEGLYDMISAFGDTSETAKLLEINTKAASAGLSSMQEAVALTSAVTKGYGDTSAKAVQQVADLAFQTVKLGQTTFPQLAESMGRVVPLATAMGVSQEELFSVFATATGVTGKAAEVSTQMRGMLQALMAPSAMMTKLLQSQNIASGEVLVKQKGLAGAMQFVTKAAKDAGLPLQELIGSIEGQTIALSLSGAQAGTWAEKMKSMQNVAGTADQAFKDQTQGINKTGFKIAQAMQRLIVLAQKFGDVIAPAIGKALDAFTPLLSILSKISPSAMMFIGVLGAMAAAIGPMLLIVSQLMAAFATVSTAIAAAGGAMAILSNPIGWVIGGLMLLTAAITYVGIHWSKQLKQMLTIARFVLLPITLLFERIWTVAKFVFTKVAALAKFILEPIGNFISTILDDITKLMNMALPDFIKKRIGVDVSGSVSASNLTAEAAQNDATKNEFKGTLVIKGAPAGSSISTERGSMDTELDSGIIMGGV